MADDTVPALILMTNWCYTKMASQEIIIICILYLIIWLYCVQNIIKIGRWVSKIMQAKVVSFSSMTKNRAWLKKPIFMVHDSQGSAETLVRRVGITNCHLIAYSFGNTSGKNYQNLLMCIEVIVCNVSVVFWDTVYVYIHIHVDQQAVYTQCGQKQCSHTIIHDSN